MAEAGSEETLEPEDDGPNGPRHVSLPLSSHYPAIPPPLKLSLAGLPEHACPYLPGRTAMDRAIWAGSMPPEIYEQFMNAGFRRSGKLLYQPACRGCRACLSVRVPVRAFRPDKSQRRCARRNGDLHVTNGPPRCSQEKFELYCKYLVEWHRREDVDGPGAFKSFLYDSPLDSTLEFEYRSGNGQLVAVGICDLCPSVLSSVYLYFDPAESRRGLGTFAVLHEIEFARDRGLMHYYLGFWIEACGAMAYKRNFVPNEVLHPDGIWRSLTP
jgi:arginine-tRNA-protein transferase